jgi:tripartite-type tricarboxylate transporter receptor subunit TctC
LHAETVKVLADGVVRQRLAVQGFDRGGTTPEQFAGIIRRDLARRKKVIASASIRAE